MTKVFPTGALPPSGVAWQMGKTAATITFVNDASKFIEQNPQHAGIEQLQEAITNAKSGKLVLTNWTTPEKYLKKNQPK